MKIIPPKIERPSRLIDLLYWLTVLGALSRQYLLTLANNSNYMYRVLQEAIDAGLIIQKDIPGAAKRDKPLTYYHVTSRGIAVLSRSYDVLPENASWVRYLIPPQKVVVTREGTTTDRSERYLSIAGMSLIAAHIGAPTQAMSFERLCEVRKQMERRETLSASPSALVNAALQARNETEQIVDDNLSLSHSEIVFHSAFEVKERISAKHKNQEKLIRIGRYTGYLESPYISVLTYVGDRNGMTWSTYFHEAEQKAYGCFKKLYSVYGHSRSDGPKDIHGIMMVANAKLFADLFLDLKGARKKELFAEKFTSFHVFPVNGQGILLLRMFMENRYEDYEQSMAKHAIESGYYQKNDASDNDLLPICTMNDIPVMIGVFMNTSKLNRLLKLIRKTGLRYAILCYEWEVEYYKRVLGDDVNYYTCY